MFYLEYAGDMCGKHSVIRGTVFFVTAFTSHFLVLFFFTSAKLTQTNSMLMALEKYI